MSSSFRSRLAVMCLCLVALVASTHAFAPNLAAASLHSRLTQWRLPFSVTVPSEAPSDVISSTPPSWENLAATINETMSASEKEPVLTLYRDTNGWCPFCERVWMALRAKDIPYRESLVSLQNKPEWYKELVPTGLVPAILFHDNENDKPERRIVWESLDIMKALDEAFPSTPRLVLDTPEFQAAQKMNDNLIAAGFRYSYASRNESLTEQEKALLLENFEAELDMLDDALKASEGLFRLGSEFTGIDAIMMPALERWRYQLPITHDMNILENRPSLQKWFDAMDSYAPYAGRVAGDEYSWTATTSMFLRYFGGGDEKPHVVQGIQRADAAAEQLSSSFAEKIPTESNSVYAMEAAQKLVTNHDAVVKDCTRQDPLSQKDLIRAKDEDAADSVLRYVASILLASPVVETARRAMIVDIPQDKLEDASSAARTVAARLCVPRDMSAPAAAYLRGVLTIVADRLEGAKEE